MLPSWDTTPADLPRAIKEIKKAIRARIEASGRTVEEVFAVVEDRIRREVDDVRSGQGWPVLDYADIESGAADSDLVKRRGCLVIRNHFDRSQALAWDASIVDYVESNDFFAHYRGPGDDFFGSVGSKPEIYPIYWSPAQTEARSHPRMATVQRFLNGLWHHDGWFDPATDVGYPDRIRRRPPGTDSNGLGTHLDPGTLDLWMTAEYQQAFRHLFDGTPEQYDPWDAAHRTTGPQYPGTTMCSVFRTFQGWTALSDMAHDQGVLHTVPIPGAMAYLMLRPLLDDVPDDEMCGVTVNQVFPVSSEYHSLLLEALTGIPDVHVGDSVWWHCDMIHSVAPVQNQEGWGNVMYIPAAPSCERNNLYQKQIHLAHVTGSSPSDFPEEHYERTWPNRSRPEDHTEHSAVAG
ncbi:YbiU family protein [Lentzea sp. JNUCC 0626]|uniref:YbiU family protein n=1 Tax=Lentzea sp. JNUCC 0626 TaxID=3367513 RepID=UPI003747BA8D